MDDYGMVTEEQLRKGADECLEASPAEETVEGNPTEEAPEAEGAPGTERAPEASLETESEGGWRAVVKEAGAEVLADVKRYGAALLDFLLPRFCVVCGRTLLLHEQYMCIYCYMDFPYTYNWRWKENRMADRFNELIQRDLRPAFKPCASYWPGLEGELFAPPSVDGYPPLGEGLLAFRSGGEIIEREPRCWGSILFDNCAECLDYSWYASHGGGEEDPRDEAGGRESVGYERYVYAVALFLYSGYSDYRHITQSLKYSGNIGEGRYFSRKLADRVAQAEHFKDVDLVVPVPLHWWREWKRGYNQAEVIAGEIAAKLGVPMRKDLLVRRRRTASQTKMSIEEKMANVRNAFAVREDLAAEPPAAGHIMLVDDVFTTGATLRACFNALRTVYPRDVRISIATLGCVGSW